MSHPMWVRGLKHLETSIAWNETEVAPYVGAWIETFEGVQYGALSMVAPYVGAWIETSIMGNAQSPARVAPYVGAWIETSLK